MKLLNKLQTRAQTLKGKKGFTLVELIAVVAVILILVAIVVPRIGDLRGQATTAKKEANANIIQGAYERAKVSGLTNSAGVSIGSTSYAPASVDALSQDLKFSGVLSKDNTDDAALTTGLTMSGSGANILVR